MPMPDRFFWFGLILDVRKYLINLGLVSGLLYVGELGLDKMGLINQPPAPLERKYGVDKSKFSTLIPTRKFPVYWNVPTRKFDPRCLTQLTDLLPFEKQTVAAQTGYVIWHMLMAGIPMTDIERWLEVSDLTNQSLCLKTCLTHTERQALLYLVYDDIVRL